MTEVLVAIIGGIGMVTTALLANRGRQHAKATREQVENHHDTNMRDEGDQRHNQNVKTLARLETVVDGLANDLRGLRRDVGRLATADQHLTERTTANAERIRELEQTQPPNRRKEP